MRFQLLLCGLFLSPAALTAQVTPDRPINNPDAIADLRTAAGAALVSAEWRTHPVTLVPTEFNAPGPDLKPTGAPVSSLSIEPHAERPDFDDSAWDVLAPDALETRQGNGLFSAVWYRLDVTIPESIGALATAGTTVVLEAMVDDYAEIWVNGELPDILGGGASTGGSAIQGWNAVQRVVLTRNAHPGDSFTIALFAANGPLSRTPRNYIWIRSATLDFYKPERLSTSVTLPLDVEKHDPTLDRIIKPGATLERLAGGFTFIEGPVWVNAAIGGAGAHPVAEGYLLFSEPNRNVIHRFDPLAVGRQLTTYRTKSGYSGSDIAEYGQPGSNGLALDAQGRLLVCEHGNRRVMRIERNGTTTVLADRFNGGRLNSPNDLVLRSDGALFFTDPPFGLPKFHDDPRREQPHFGVYCLLHDRLNLVSTDFTGPNGIALSPDEKSLYVGNWDEHAKVVNRYDVGVDGSLSGGRVFYDFTNAPGPEAIDGVKVDAIGNVYVSAPGGLWIISPEGKHLGTLRLPELAANFCFGDADGRSLYLAAHSSLYRVRLEVMGAGRGGR